MKKRRIMIIHESGMFQRIIQRTLTAEVPDVDLHAATSSEQVEQMLAKDSYDMVISQNEMSHKNGTEIYEMLNSDSRHMNTPFLLLTSKMDKENRKLFNEKGIVNILKLPFEAGELARNVETLSHPRGWRQHKRLGVPDTRVLIRLDEDEFCKAEIVNISLGGMLCDIKVEDGMPAFSRFYGINILFPSRYGGDRVHAKGYTLRQAVLQWLEPPECEILQTAWRFSTLSPQDTNVMNDILEKAFHEIQNQEEE
ncbi:MAG: response regulator [bacterium]|nr:response regulator [bacterium]